MEPPLLSNLSQSDVRVLTNEFLWDFLLVGVSILIYLYDMGGYV
jgi:hypothetical protein